MNEPPRWGVMFNDGSVARRWNGHTARQRAEEYLRRMHVMYPGDRITLAYRPSPDEPWERVDEVG